MKFYLANQPGREKKSGYSTSYVSEKIYIDEISRIFWILFFEKFRAQ